MQHATFRALTRAALAAVLLFGSGLAAAQVLPIKVTTNGNVATATIGLTPE